VGGLRPLDEIDLQILRILQEDARTPFSRVAKEVGVSEATIHMRVKKLRETGVLKGFQAFVDPSSVGKELTAITLIKADPTRYEGDPREAQGGSRRLRGLRCNG
jgi:Lrp/AsnC family transcriptional regulator for asnA, asnC and gidA